MSVLEIIKGRFSVRHYESRKVSEDDLNTVIEAARCSQSAKNLQDWRFVVVTDAKRRAALAEAANHQKFVAQAPLVIAACAETDGHLMRCGQPCYPIDVAIAIDHMTLQAVAEGLGTCWIGAFYEEPTKKILGIPDEIRVVELLTVGYPASPPGRLSRLPMEKIIHWETW